MHNERLSCFGHWFATHALLRFVSRKEKEALLTRSFVGCLLIHTTLSSATLSK